MLYSSVIGCSVSSRVVQLCDWPVQVSLYGHKDEDIDWWSKYYASVGRLDKCRQYVELGYDKLQVSGVYTNFHFILNSFVINYKYFPVY